MHKRNGLITAGVFLFASALIMDIILIVLGIERLESTALAVAGGVNLCMWMISGVLLLAGDRQLSLQYSELARWIARDMGQEMADLTPDEFKKLIDSYAGRVYEMELLKNKAENAHLQSQINPHFLYNTLDAIRGHATADGSFEVARMIETLSRMFRYSISDKAGILTLEDELSNIEDYLSIQRYRFGNRFDVRYDIDTSDIQIMYYRVPKLILQPLVENAIQHGLEDLPSGGLITISAFHTRTRLYISVEDNGLGADMELIKDINRRLAECVDRKPNAGGGIALLNIQKRVRFQYGAEYGLKLLPGAERGLCAELELPWVDHE